MKLTEADIILLKKWGYLEIDFPQIEDAIRVSKYQLYNEQEEATFISRAKVLKLLGREKFLSGITRSAFHWSAFRENGNAKVFFVTKRPHK